MPDGKRQPPLRSIGGDLPFVRSQCSRHTAHSGEPLVIQTCAGGVAATRSLAKARTASTSRSGSALEAAGVISIDENGEGPGVRLKKKPGTEPG